jgi:hypothetical protein
MKERAGFELSRVFRPGAFPSSLGLGEHMQHARASIVI